MPCCTSVCQVLDRNKPHCLSVLTFASSCASGMTLSASFEKSLSGLREMPASDMIVNVSEEFLVSRIGSRKSMASDKTGCGLRR